MIDDLVVDLALVVQEKCTKQHARIAGKKRKFLSSQLREGLFIAGTATRSTRLIEDRTLETTEALAAEATLKAILKTSKNLLNS